MAEHDPTNVLDYLREQFSRVHARFDGIGQEMREMKQRIAGLESQVAQIYPILAAMSARMDRMDERIERIERRLDLVGVEGH